MSTMNKPKPLMKAGIPINIDNPNLIIIPKSKPKTNSIPKTTRKCKDCKVTKDINDFEPIGEKGYRKTKCIDCTTIGPVINSGSNSKDNKHGELLNEKLEAALVKFTSINDTSVTMGGKVEDIYKEMNKIYKTMEEEEKIRKEENTRRIIREVELHNGINSVTENINNLVNYIQIDKKQTVEFMNKIDEKVDKMSGIYKTNKDDMMLLLEGIEGKHEEILKVISEGKSSSELLQEQTELLTELRSDIENSNKMYLEKHLKLEVELFNMKNDLNNNIEIIAKKIKTKNDNESNTISRTIRSRSPTRTTKSKMVDMPTPPRSPKNKYDESDTSMSGIETPISDQSSEITTPTGELTESSSKLKSKYSIGIVSIDEIKELSDEELKKLINSVGRSASNYKGNKEKKQVYNIVRTNLNNLQAENKSRKQK